MTERQTDTGQNNSLNARDGGLGRGAYLQTVVTISQRHVVTVFWDHVHCGNGPVGATHQPSTPTRFCNISAISDLVSKHPQ